MGAEILDGGAPRPNLPPEDVVEDLTDVLLPLKNTQKNQTNKLFLGALFLFLQIRNLNTEKLYRFKGIKIRSF